MSGNTDVISELFSKENTCPRCDKYRSAACAFCPTCGARNEYFKESAFWDVHRKLFSKVKAESCFNNHASIKSDMRKIMEGEPLFCDLCGEQVIFSS